MAFITREDGERFIVPSYRDTLSAKKPSLIKREIVLLSQNYGEYVALQKKSLNQYEVAFSPDSGYLLGECVWYHFKRPVDMIYCEALPNSNEAILVIVKAGSVYLDGSFPIDSIPEELIIFKTQQNNFEIYVYGDVPLSQVPEDGKFSFDASSIKSFTELEAPNFPLLATVKTFQLQLVDTALAAYGIGVVPVKQIIITLVGAVCAFLFYKFLETPHKEIQVISFVSVANPLQSFNDQLTSPDPTRELQNIYMAINSFYTIPGWNVEAFDYLPGAQAKLTAFVKSQGARGDVLADWAAKNNATLTVNPAGLFLTLSLFTPKRETPTRIYRIDDVILNMIDRLSYITSGNVLTFGGIVDRKDFKEVPVTLALNEISPAKLVIIGDFLKGLPLTLLKANIKVSNGNLSGTINFKALGN